MAQCTVIMLTVWLSVTLHNTKKQSGTLFFEFGRVNTAGLTRIAAQLLRHEVVVEKQYSLALRHFLFLLCAAEAHDKPPVETSTTADRIFVTERRMTMIDSIQK